jgi:DNA ligase D-like protein (predicted 3'-phosphoesterase)
MPLEEHRPNGISKKVAEPPAGRVQASKGRLSCLIQKRDARHLQYDFRHELEGSLPTWAVSKGASLNAADKRLAVEAEENPVAYGSSRREVRVCEVAGTCFACATASSARIGY